MIVTRAPLLGEPVAVELMNTIWADRDGSYDALGTPEEAMAWLRAIAQRLAPAPREVAAWLGAGQGGHAAGHLRNLRDAARRLAADATGVSRVAPAVPDRPAALRALARAAAGAPVWSTLQWDPDGEPARALHTSAAPGRAVVAMLAAATVDLFAGDLRVGLRACQAPGCILYFVKQHPRREWCSTRCGNRARVARHYQRHRVEL